MCFESTARGARGTWRQADLFVCFSGACLEEHSTRRKKVAKPKEKLAAEERRLRRRLPRRRKGEGARREHDRQGERPRCDSRLAPQGEGEDGGGARLLAVGLGGQSTVTDDVNEVQVEEEVEGAPTAMVVGWARPRTAQP